MLPLVYDIRNLQVRRIRTLSTAVCVALVVGVLCYLLALAEGLRRTLRLSGDPHNLTIVADGATSESNSALTHAEAAALVGIPNLALGRRDDPLVSPEVVVQTTVVRRGDTAKTPAGVTVRGVHIDVARQCRPAVRLVSGRWFRDGLDELVVGVRAAERFDLDVGATLGAGERTFLVVGTFAAAGGVQESECWGHLANVASAYHRQRYSSATVRLRSEEDPDLTAAIDYIASNVDSLRAARETEFFRSQAGSAGVIESMAIGLLVVMGIGAVLAAAVTMHSSVAGRTREIAVLRAIGFSRSSVISSVLAESLLVAALGGCLGCLGCAAFVWRAGGAHDLVGSATFSSVAFEVRLTAREVVISMLAAMIIGAIGGAWPARSATRMPLVQALRTV